MIFVARDRHLHLYRRALYEARRNDLDLNSSEAALLALLRREQEIAQVEHFLIEHHRDLREFWDREDSFTHEENALLSAGILFHSQDKIVIPEDVAPAIWQTLGIDMPTTSVRRLLEYLSNVEIANALEMAGTRTSGSKDLRIERIVRERIQPRFVLRNVGLSTLREICRATDAPVTGNKEDLIERIVAHFAEGRDQRVDEPPEPPVREIRRLTQVQFKTLFSALQHQELSDILRRRSDLRQTGTKDVRIATLWEAHLSEATLLGELMNRQLEDLLHRLGLKLGGSKQIRIDRVVEYFAGTASSAAAFDPVPREEVSAPGAQPVLADDVAQNQILFKQKSSNPQASLQPWLEIVLDAKGLVRCYATEDANPTKQLKNKLSQAAAAQDGLLVLLLADGGAYLKAREALLERWMSNPEWPKSVACIALAYPVASPEIGAIIQRTGSRLATKLLKCLFPTAEVSHVGGDHHQSPAVAGIGAGCDHCGTALPIAARFCPGCGERIRHG